MSIVPLVRGAAYAPFIEFIAETGDREFERSGASRVAGMLGEDAEALVPAPLAHAMMERFAGRNGLNDFGFVVGRNTRLESLGAFGAYLRNSLTLRDVMGKVRSKLPLFSSIDDFVWRRSEGGVDFLHRYRRAMPPGSRYAQQHVLLLMREAVRLAAGPAWRPEIVYSPRPEEDAAVFDRAFPSAMLRKDDCYGFAIPAHLLDAPVRARLAVDGAARAFEPSAFEAFSPSGDFVGAVRQVVAAMLVGGRCRLEDAAEAIGVTPRTLQRRLRAHEVAYSEVLARARFEKALSMLAEPRPRLIEIANELGYADPSNFSRAFRAWTGVSPSEYRRARRPAAGGV